MIKWNKYGEGERPKLEHGGGGRSKSWI